MKLFKTAVAILSISLSACFTSVGAGEKLAVLCSTFPIYQITLNVVGNQKGIAVNLMLPAQLGCPHDYALTPQDMRKLAEADVLVVNGLELEEFLGDPIDKINDDLKIIDSSKGIKNLIEYTDDKGHEHHESAHHEHDQNCKHHHHNINPHLFVSPSMQVKLAENIADGLAEIDKKNKTAFQKNSQIYAEKMRKLANDLQALGGELKNNRIIQPHGVFDYLARDAGLEIIDTVQSHGHQPSAAEMIKIINKIRKEKAGAIFTEPQYPEKIGKTLSRETNIPVAMLDPTATGPQNAPLNYYEQVMKKNILTIRNTLGVK